MNTYTFNLCEMPNRNTILIVTLQAESQAAAFLLILSIWKVKDNFEWFPGTVLNPIQP
jgi:hypothetical protein